MLAPLRIAAKLLGAVFARPRAAFVPPADVVVTVTPCAVTADSRTLKQVASVGRWGFRSLLVEGLRSDLEASSFGFERLVLPDRVLDRDTSGPPPAPGLVRRGFLLARYAASFGGALAVQGVLLPALFLPRGRLFVVAAPHAVLAVWVRCLVDGSTYVHDARRPTAAADRAAATIAGRLLVQPVLRALEAASRRGAAVTWLPGAEDAAPSGAIHVVPLEQGLHELSSWSDVLRTGWSEGRGDVPPATARDVVESLVGHAVLEELGFLRGAHRHVVRYLRSQGLIAALRLPPARLYYVHSPYLVPAVLLRAWLHRAPIIYDAHDFYSHLEPSETRTRLGQFVFDFQAVMERALVRAAAKVVVVSEGQAELHRRAFGRSPLVVRNCQDARLDRPLPVGLRALIGAGPEDIVVVATGAAKGGQAFEQALEALQLVPPSVHLVMLGRGHAGRQAAVDARGLRSRVHLVDAVRAFEVVPFIRSADAAILLYFGYSPNYVTCLPNGLFQSIDAGLPLIYPDLPELAALGDRFDLGIKVDPLDPTDLARGLRWLLDPDERAGARERVRRAADELAWSREEQVLAGAFDELIGRPHQARREASDYASGANVPSPTR